MVWGGFSPTYFLLFVLQRKKTHQGAGCQDDSGGGGTSKCPQRTEGPTSGEVITAPLTPRHTMAACFGLNLPGTNSRSEEAGTTTGNEVILHGLAARTG